MWCPDLGGLIVHGSVDMSRTYQHLKMMLHFMETFGSNYPLMQNHTAEAQNPQPHCCENLRTCNEVNMEM